MVINLNQNFNQNLYSENLRPCSVVGVNSALYAVVLVQFSFAPFDLKPWASS